MRAIPLVLAALTALPLMFVGASGCEMTTSEATLDTGPASAELGIDRFYEDNDPCWWCVLPYTVWIYQESNGVDGLQRGDEWVDDTCGGTYTPDTIIY
jgi:hypothetical protein